MKKYVSYMMFVFFLGIGGKNIDLLAEGIEAVRLPAEDSVAVYRLRTLSSGYLQQFRENPLFFYQRKENASGWWERLRQWLGRHIFRARSYEGASRIEEMLLRGAAGILLLFLAYQLIRRKFFFPWVRKKEFVSIAESDLEPLQEAEEYRQHIEQAVERKQYAWAVRLYYGYILWLMDQKGLIRWERWKPNRSYVHELTPQALKQPFARLSRIFDCVCYGEFEVDADLYQQLEREFQDFRQKIAV